MLLLLFYWWTHLHEFQMLFAGDHGMLEIESVFRGVRAHDLEEALHKLMR